MLQLYVNIAIATEWLFIHSILSMQLVLYIEILPIMLCLFQHLAFVAIGTSMLTTVEAG